MRRETASREAMLALALALAVLLVSSAAAASATTGRVAGAKPAPVLPPALVLTSTRTGIPQGYGYDLATGELVQLSFPRWELLSRGSSVQAAPDARRALLSGDTAEIVTSGGGRMTISVLPRPADAAWSPDSRSVLGTQPSQPLVVVRASDGTQRTVGAGYIGGSPAWSPDGRRIAFLHQIEVGTYEYALAVIGVAGGTVRDLTPFDADGVTPAWAPDGSRIAVVRGRGTVLQVVSVASGARRTVSGTGVSGPVRWSPDGRWLAYVRAGRVELVRPDGSGRRTPARQVRVLGASETTLGWSRTNLLAISDRNGLRVYDPAARTMRSLDAQPSGAFAWTPDGTALAYEATRTHALRVVGLGWRPRTLRTFAATSTLRSIDWVAEPFAGKQPEPVAYLERRTADGGIELRAEVRELVANGDELAFLACGNVVGVWKPAAGTVAHPLPAWATGPLTPYSCIDRAWESRQTVSIALDDGELAYWRYAGGNAKFWNLFAGVPPVDANSVSSWGATTGFPPRAGWTRAEGDLLVFSTRDYTYTGSAPTVTGQTLWRVEQKGYAGACPVFGYPTSFTWTTTAGRCRPLAFAVGPLVPLDVNDGRIAALRADATVAVLDGGDGHTIAATPTGQPAVDAALSGSDLVVLRPGSLARYDASTGALLRAFPLPDVAAGRHCVQSEWDCPRGTRLFLEDAADGVAAYTLDGRLHLLRLSDGSDTDVASATLARFVGSGVVYVTPQTGNWTSRLTWWPR